MAKKKVTVAVIGHVNSGKTTLTSVIAKVLSRKYGLCSPVSVETIDNPPVERAGGLEIRYSMVECETPERHYTLVDCPRHADWIKILISGHIKFDGAIIVVPVTDGMMSQTHEHLLLAHEVGIPHTVVYLNKCDMVDDEELVELVELEIRETLDSFGYDGDNADVILGSAKVAQLVPDGEYTDSVLELVDAMDRWFSAPMPKSEQPFLMVVEDVLFLTGKGAVATGKVERGTARVGDEVEIIGLRDENKLAKITGIQMFGRILDSAGPGDNVGFLFKGLTRADIERGQVLASPIAEPRPIRAYTQFVANVYVHTKEEGGRHTPIFNHYRPQFCIWNTFYDGLIYMPEGVEMCLPGDNMAMTIELLHPVALEEGTRFTIREGGFTIGTGVVFDFYDEGVPSAVRAEKPAPQPVPAPEKPAPKAVETPAPKAEPQKKAEPAPTKAETDPKPKAKVSWQQAKKWLQEGNEYFDKGDYEKSCELYRKAAEAGNAEAQNKLGFSYSKGKGVEKNTDEALNWYTKAAKKGYPAAQNNLGYYYYKGIGVEQDYHKAVHWFEKAADQGNASAQEGLGTCYRYGFGTKKDIKMAKYWYKKAAEQGNESAKEKLKELKWPWSK
ncbi:MAG: elongation factor Tu [Firmicutes bacterium]|nr:elongation factor Tu [Bacillota bacterium]